jgi:hypothetical protein
MEELRMEDQQSFFNFLRMPLEMFDEILNRVGSRIRIVNTPQENIGTGPQASYHYSTFSVRWQVSNFAVRLQSCTEHDFCICKLETYTNYGLFRNFINVRVRKLKISRDPLSVNSISPEKERFFLRFPYLLLKLALPNLYNINCLTHFHSFIRPKFIFLMKKVFCCKGLGLTLTIQPCLAPLQEVKQRLAWIFSFWIDSFFRAGVCIITL